MKHARRGGHLLLLAGAAAASLTGVPAGPRVARGDPTAAVSDRRAKAGVVSATASADAETVRAPQPVPVYDYQVVRTYPHDPAAFTEGLFYLDGFLYESTGLEGHSTIRKVRLQTGEVLQKIAVPARYFGEGIVAWKKHLIELTWKSQIGFVYDLGTFQLQRQFQYAGEGWALTQDGQRLIMSDGTDQLRFLDPDSLRESGRLRVTYQNQPLPNLNELEWVKGEIFANVWQTNIIVRIDPDTGHVVGVVNLAGLLAPADMVPGHTDVLNGIAYDAKQDRLFVTGKNWPKVFEIRLRATRQSALTR